eukprot:g834.t1
MKRVFVDEEYELLDTRMVREVDGSWRKCHVFKRLALASSVATIVLFFGKDDFCERVYHKECIESSSIRRYEKNPSTWACDRCATRYYGLLTLPKPYPSHFKMFYKSNVASSNPEVTATDLERQLSSAFDNFSQFYKKWRRRMWTKKRSGGGIASTAMGRLEDSGTSAEKRRRLKQTTTKKKSKKPRRHSLVVGISKKNHSCKITTPLACTTKSKAGDVDLKDCIVSQKRSSVPNVLKIEASDRRSRGKDLDAENPNGVAAKSHNGSSADVSRAIGRSRETSNVTLSTAELSDDGTHRPSGGGAASAGAAADDTTKTWTCTKCTFENEFDVRICIICNGRRPRNAQRKIESTPQSVKKRAKVVRGGKVDNSHSSRDSSKRPSVVSKPKRASTRKRGCKQTLESNANVDRERSITTPSPSPTPLPEIFSCTSSSKKKKTTTKKQKETNELATAYRATPSLEKDTNKASCKEYVSASSGPDTHNKSDMRRAMDEDAIERVMQELLRRSTESHSSSQNVVLGLRWVNRFGGRNRCDVAIGVPISSRRNSENQLILSVQELWTSREIEQALIVSGSVIERCNEKVFGVATRDGINRQRRLMAKMLRHVEIVHLSHGANGVEHSDGAHMVCRHTFDPRLARFFDGVTFSAKLCDDTATDSDNAMLPFCHICRQQCAASFKDPKTDARLSAVCGECRRVKPKRMYALRAGRCRCKECAILRMSASVHVVPLPRTSSSVESKTKSMKAREDCGRCVGCHLPLPGSVLWQISSSSSLAPTYAQLHRPQRKKISSVAKKSSYTISCDKCGSVWHKSCAASLRAFRGRQKICERCATTSSSEEEEEKKNGAIAEEKVEEENEKIDTHLSNAATFDDSKMCAPVDVPTTTKEAGVLDYVSVDRERAKVEKEHDGDSHKSDDGDDDDDDDDDDEDSFGMCVCGNARSACEAMGATAASKRARASALAAEEEEKTNERIAFANVSSALKMLVSKRLFVQDFSLPTAFEPSLRRLEKKALFLPNRRRLSSARCVPNKYAAAYRTRKTKEWPEERVSVGQVTSSAALASLLAHRREWVHLLTEKSDNKRSISPILMMMSPAAKNTSVVSQRRQQRRQARAFASSTAADLEKEAKKKLRFGRSKIHAWGVFAQEKISAGDVIIEYKGEIIRHQVADLREEKYERLRFDDYFFRIDQSIICDATQKGSLARFINHSCDPNCRTQIVTENGQKKIFIYAKRDIAIDEELAYDYKFSIEEDKIYCSCGAVNCRGTLN